MVSGEAPMRKNEVLEKYTIAISVSESPDMPALGLSVGHLRDAMCEISRHLLALGARLAYGGDLRHRGFSELLFELVARHRLDADEEHGTGIVNYLSWPTHSVFSAAELEAVTSEFEGAAEIVCLNLDGSQLPTTERLTFSPQFASADEWTRGLTAMRNTIFSRSDARIVLGGRVDGFRGIMPGIAEESFLSLKHQQPIYVLGGFGGCARDIAESVGLLSSDANPRKAWPGLETFDAFSSEDMNNGLNKEENSTLAKTPHVDQAVALVLRGLMRMAEKSYAVMENKSA